MSSRQQKILRLLSAGIFSRIQLQKALTEKVSKPTLFRDLRSLISVGLVTSSGVGKATVYQRIDEHPLLHEPKKNFSTEKPILFNFEVFNHLTGLFTPGERAHLDRIYKSLNAQIAKLGNTIAKRELERFVIELAWKSSRIEGNTYSLLETETLIKMHQEAEGHTKEEAAMILNHKAAFDTMFARREGFKTLRMSDITQLHTLLIQNLGVDPGVRNHPVGITGSAFRPLDNQWQIREALEKLIKAINSSHHPFEKALIASSMVAYIQPFADGNKRTSRMLTNAILVAHDFYPISYRVVNETTYKQALITFYEQHSLYELKRILIEQYEFALDNYFRTSPSLALTAVRVVGLKKV